MHPPNLLSVIAELIYIIISDDHCTMRNTVSMKIVVAQEVVTVGKHVFTQFCG